MILRALICALLGIIYGSGHCQSLNQSEIKELSWNYFPSAIKQYREFLNLANDGNYPSQINQNVKWCVESLEQRRFQTRIIESKGIPHVFAERNSPKSSKTILFYLQIDGQPVDTSSWFQPNPYQAELKMFENESWISIPWESVIRNYDPDYRVYARSASDSKGPAMAFLSAIDILLMENIEPEFNLKVIADFQEELGSPTLPQLVLDNQELLNADMMLIMDGTRHLSNLPTLTFGARGMATVTLKVFGAKRDLHSGQYGNYAPNPVFKLAKLIGEMKDEEGRVIIPGFYDGVYITEKEKKMLNTLPEDPVEIQNSLGIAKPDAVGNSYQEALQYPSLNVRGIQAAWVGKEVRTLIPSEAIAEIDMRLVAETEGIRQVNLIKRFIENRGYHFVDSIPTDAERQSFDKLISFTYRVGSKPFRTDLDSSIADWLSLAMERAFNDQFVKMRTTGGSQPIAPFITTLGIPAVSVRIPNPDNNIHAPNENLRLGNFLEGIQMCLSILTQEFK